METTKITNGRYKVEHNNKVFEIVKTESGLWKIYEVEKNEYGTDDLNWWDNRWTKKEALEYIEEKF